MHWQGAKSAIDPKGTHNIIIPIMVHVLMIMLQYTQAWFCPASPLSVLTIIAANIIKHIHLHMKSFLREVIVVMFFILSVSSYRHMGGQQQNDSC